MITTAKQPLKVFLCHASEDKPDVRKVHQRLVKDGIDVWLDEEDLLPGQDWDFKIQKAVREADAIIIFFSKNAISKRGYIQREVRIALAIAEEQPEGEIYLIPARLEKCDMPFRLKHLHYVDLFEKDGYEKLIRSLQVRAKNVDTSVNIKISQLESALHKKSQRESGSLPPLPTRRSLYSLRSIIIAVVVVVIGLFAITALNFPQIRKFFIQRTPTIPYSTPSEPAPAQTLALPTDTPLPPPPIIPASLPDITTDVHGISMALVPAGEFKMGAEEGPESEAPVSAVYLDDFYIDVYEVTNAAYKECVEDNACETPKNSFDAFEKQYYGTSEYDNFPVIYVSWPMAKAYCEWRGARLPTSAEWEKAARGTDQRRFPWGEEIDCRNANYHGCEGNTSEVGAYTKDKSPYGVYDMGGNVSEWVFDSYSPTHYRFLTPPSTNPVYDELSDSHVLRGGSWVLESGYARTTSRRKGYPLDGNSYAIGFRCARSVSADFP